MSEDELINLDYPWLEENSTVSKAFPILKRWDVILLKRDGLFSGAVAKKDLLRTKLSPNAKLRRFMTHPPVVDSQWEVGEVARLMLENDIFLVPILNNKKIEGVIDGTNLIAKASRGEFGKEKIRQYMVSPVHTIGPTDSIARAESIMREKGISRLPVLEGGELLGIITMDDLIENVYHPEHRPRGAGSKGDQNKYGEKVAEKKEYLKMPVKGLMSEAVVSMSPDSTVREVVDRLTEMDYRGMVLKDDDGDLGIVTRKDLIRPIAEFYRPGNFHIRFSGELHRLPDFRREESRAELLDHLGMHEDYLGRNDLLVFLKLHRETKRGERLTLCELRLTSPRARYVATDEGWGHMQAIRNAAQALEKQIRRGKRH